MPGWDWGRLKLSSWGHLLNRKADEGDQESVGPARSSRRRGKDKGFYCSECGAPLEPYDTWCPECSLIRRER